MTGAASPDSVRGRGTSARSIGAVIVTYFPDEAFAGRLDRVVPQVDVVIIVDNSASPHVSEHLRSVMSADVELIANAHNEGIAHALNQGVLRAAALGCSWVLTLDQDTEVDPELVHGLLAIYEQCRFRDGVGLIHANARSRWSGQLAVRCRHPDERFIEAKTVVTSGSLMSVSAYHVAGAFRDDFFIEGVDLEYCLRLRHRGFRVLLSCKPFMTHAAGRMEEHRLGRRTIIVPNHAPWRYYYVTRNLLRIFAAYGGREPRWTLSALVNLAKTFAKMLLFEDRRVEKLQNSAIGAWDALTRSHRNRFLPE